ncbi:MAG: cupin domain-containing protein [Pseudomonadota bacterium]
MIRFPSALTAASFLDDYWQKRPLFMPAAIDGPKPSLTRNELAWLATLDDVESRIVFTDRSGAMPRYRAEAGPFDEAYLQQLPKRDWTLLVHDVEKHLPEFRALFTHVPFIPDWRIDDLMVSFAAPGGSVGPHKDHYDVFLVQGKGVRSWQVTTDDVATDAAASDELALLAEFAGDDYSCKESDVLYLPPGVPHWGTATRACLTYSIGMRAPQLADLVDKLPDDAAVNPFYRDADLSIDEIQPGYISRQARERASRLGGQSMHCTALGRFVSLGKDWLQPEKATPG